MRKVLVINLGWEQQPLIERLKNEPGTVLFGVSENFLEDTRFEKIYNLNFRDLPGLIKLAEELRIDAVISDQCDYSYYSQSFIANKLDLPGPSIKTSLIATNKYYQRKLAEQKGILQPEFKLCFTAEDVVRFTKEHGFPIITKPVDNRGSFGVNKVNNKDEVATSFFNSLANSTSRLVIAEKFIKGIHITVDGYVFPRGRVKSLALASKKLLQDELQVAMEIIYPGELGESIYNKAMENNEFVNRELGFSFGMTHSEYMIDENENIFLIESANRGGGVFTSEIIVPNVCGIGLVDQYVSDCLGIKRDNFREIQRNKTILKFFNLPSGKIRKINGIEEILKTEGILKFRLNYKENDLISNITTDADRHGFIIYTNNKSENIGKDAEEIFQKLKVKY